MNLRANFYVPSQVPCEIDEFHCNDGRCISESWVCDDDSDCDGGEDEHEDECGIEVRLGLWYLALALV